MPYTFAQLPQGSPHAVNRGLPPVILRQSLLSSGLDDLRHPTVHEPGSSGAPPSSP
jgi:hypothetical protein